MPARFVPSAHMQQSSKVPLYLLRMCSSHSVSHHIETASDSTAPGFPEELSVKDTMHAKNC